ncbi:MAG TPA: hypothetical protein VNG13_02640 [Mycobacteriales bacterium]|nr:hypothetical protein [Mycobacteriales bacterium]
MKRRLVILATLTSLVGLGGGFAFADTTQPAPGTGVTHIGPGQQYVCLGNTDPQGNSHYIACVWF